LVTAPGPWRDVDVHASVDSTNFEALRDPRVWRVVVADYQSAGRGRLARQWEAPAGTSIAVSAVVPVPPSRAADLGWLPLLSGMAMRQALEDVAGVSGRLKWPNDVMVQEQAAGLADNGASGLADNGVPGLADNGVPGLADNGASGLADNGASGLTDNGAPWLKISGILCEMAPGGELVVIGAGANIAQERDELPVDTATSLALCGARNLRREDVIAGYLGALADLHQTWSAGGARLDALRTAYRSRCLTIGLDVDVHQPGGRVVRGTATGVDAEGRLVVTAGGSSLAHAAGDVVHVRRSQPGAGHTA
jgi:BirA family biotin operon repressor/biotin-[acetyl-CoA-carboxylase] ligase